VKSALFKLRYLIIIACVLTLAAIIAYRFLDFISKSGKKGEETVLTVNSIKIKKEIVSELLTFEGIAEGNPQIKVYPTANGKFQENSVQEGASVEANSTIVLIDRDVVGSHFLPAPVRSPINGVVTKLYYMDRGTYVTLDRPVAEVADTGNIKVPLNIGEEDLVRVKANMPARIYSINDPLRFVTGSVFSVTPFIDKDTLTGSIIIKGANRNNLLTIGMSVGIDVTIGSREMVMVPEEALGMGANVTFVYVNNQNTARKVSVVTGFRKAGSVEIRGDIKEGDEVVTTGSFKLYDGARIRILN
jgi:membrane fusion protein (multidrug efflux system)